MSSTVYVRALAPDKAARERDDFYPSPPVATRALLRVEAFDGVVWECACGDGAISRELEALGHQVISTDLIDRGYGTGGVDFLLDWRTDARHVITNPPFKHAEAFALHALARVPGKVALLCRLAWLEGGRRHARLFGPKPPARVWVFRDRVPIHRGRQKRPDENGGMIAFAWFVWDPTHAGPSQLGWI